MLKFQVKRSSKLRTMLNSDFQQELRRTAWKLVRGRVAIGNVTSSENLTVLAVLLNFSLENQLENEL